MTKAFERPKNSRHQFWPQAHKNLLIHKKSRATFQQIKHMMGSPLNRGYIIQRLNSTPMLHNSSQYFIYR